MAQRQVPCRAPTTPDALTNVGGLGGTAGLEAALREALGKLTAGSELPLGDVLSPQAPSGELVKALEATTHLPVASLIESLPTGVPVQNLDVAELASTLSKTPQQLAESLGQTLSTLPETASAATQALSGGDELALLKGLEGLDFGLVERTPAGGATGGNGGNGGTPAPGTIVVNVPASSASSAGATPVAAASASAAGKVEIVSHNVSDRKATLVVQVPSAGRLTVSGNGFGGSRPRPPRPSA